MDAVEGLEGHRHRLQSRTTDLHLDGYVAAQQAYPHAPDLTDIRHRAEVVECRISQHLDVLSDRLKALDMALP